MRSHDSVVCVFKDLEDMYDAVSALRSANFHATDIGFAVTDHEGLGNIETVEHEGGEEAAHRLSDTLVDVGLTPAEAAWYDARVREGQGLVSVHAAGRAEEARLILLDYGGLDYQADRAIRQGRPWHEIAPSLRQRFLARGGTPRQWKDDETAHRFGYEAFERVRAEGGPMTWEANEPHLRVQWEREGHGSWDLGRKAIRRGFELGDGRLRFDTDNYPPHAREISGALATATSGALIGGLVGGPVGLVAGVIIGGALGAIGGATLRDRDDEQ
ncbi:MAG: hypothetical protein IT305_14320 [Chloroflexi bacterium]|nr:hypothetical protein [Chloroflexota bacterium]